MNVASLVQPILGLHGWVVYLIVGALVFGEAALFVGFVLPGETAVLIGGVLASQGRVSLSLLIVVVVLAAVAGDSVGFEVGRHFGDRVLALGPLQRRRAGVDRARLTLRERGSWAVFVGRFTAFLRAVMPGLAGLSRMPYRKFLLANAAGGIVWGGGFVVLGYLAGASFNRVSMLAGRFSVAVLVVVVVAVVVVVVVHRRRTRGEEKFGGTRTDDQV